MSDLTPEEIDIQKRAIYDKMSPRRRKFVDRLGYENWDPFQLPFDPIDIRREQTGLTANELVDAFLETLSEKPSPDFVQSVREFAILLLHNKERVKPVFEFCSWYSKRLETQGQKL